MSRRHRPVGVCVAINGGEHYYFTLFIDSKCYFVMQLIQIQVEPPVH